MWSNDYKRKNELKTLTKHISCICEYKFDERKCNSDQCRNNDKFRYECRERHVWEKDYVWNSATYSCENGKYLANVMDDSAMTCDEIIRWRNKIYSNKF